MTPVTPVTSPRSPQSVPGRHSDRACRTPAGTCCRCSNTAEQVSWPTSGGSLSSDVVDAEASGQAAEHAHFAEGVRARQVEVAARAEVLVRLDDGRRQVRVRAGAVVVDARRCNARSATGPCPTASSSWRAACGANPGSACRTPCRTVRRSRTCCAPGSGSVRNSSTYVPIKLQRRGCPTLPISKR